MEKNWHLHRMLFHISSQESKLQKVFFLLSLCLCLSMGYTQGTQMGSQALVSYCVTFRIRGTEFCAQPQGWCLTNSIPRRQLFSMTFSVTLGQPFNKKAFYHFTKDSYMLQESVLSSFCDIGSISWESLLQLVSRSQVNFLGIFISTPLGVLLCSKPKPR